MHSKPKTQAQTQTRKQFQWGISSTAIRFMQTDAVEAAREGCNDCSKISPLPKPKRKDAAPGEGRK
jgi:hypothetical protein